MQGCLLAASLAAVAYAAAAFVAVLEETLRLLAQQLLPLSSHRRRKCMSLGEKLGDLVVYSQVEGHSDFEGLRQIPRIVESLRCC